MGFFKLFSKKTTLIDHYEIIYLKLSDKTANSFLYGWAFSFYIYCY